MVFYDAGKIPIIPAVSAIFLNCEKNDDKHLEKLLNVSKKWTEYQLKIKRLSIFLLVRATTKPEYFLKTGQSYLDVLARKFPKAEYVTDKMPFNYMWIGLISLALPNAKIILCRRNPMDCGLSIYRQNFLSDTTWYCDLKSIGQAYQQFNILAKHWENIMQDKIFVADYNRIVTNPQKR